MVFRKGLMIENEEGRKDNQNRVDGILYENLLPHRDILLVFLPYGRREIEIWSEDEDDG